MGFLQPTLNQCYASTDREQTALNTSLFVSFFRVFRGTLAAHNGLVPGSSPGRPTNEIRCLSILIFSAPPEISTQSRTNPSKINKSSQWHSRRTGRVRRCLAGLLSEYRRRSNGQGPAHDLIARNAGFSSTADLPQRYGHVSFGPLATNAVQQIASYSITASARAGVLPIVCPHLGDPMPAFLSGPRPAPGAHASLLKLPPPSNYFLCRDPGAGFAPSCLK
ncbi:MAG: hypothetical protein JWO45_1841 [Spartobacteria bacterium]|nr:hypothetical protein [Spartobacteria bacterium]